MARSEAQGKIQSSLDIPKVDGNGCPIGLVEVVPGLANPTPPGTTSSPLQSSFAADPSTARPSAQSVPQTSASRPIQSAIERIEYITRPQIDAIGRPTGAVEVVPASLVPSGTTPIGLTPVGTSPAGITSSEGSNGEAVTGGAVGGNKAQDGVPTASKPNQAQVQRIESLTRPQIDAVGRPTGAVEVVPASAVPSGTTPPGTTPGGTTSSGSSAETVTGNVVSVSEALSRAADKATNVPGQAGAVANRPGASSNKPGATPKQAGAVPNKAGAGAVGSDEQCWKESKIERSSSWKAR